MRTQPLPLARLAAALLAMTLAACPKNGPEKEPDAGSLDDGAACLSNAACKSGYCVNIYGKRQCAARCSGNSCPASYECKHAVARDQTSPGICVGKSTRLCGICGDDLDCGPAGDLCIAEGGSRYCGSDCGFTGSCPPGYACEDVTDGAVTARQCRPLTGTCTCDDLHVGVTRPCEASNEYGTCAGEQECLGTLDGWTSCDAPDAGPEICNGEDDDCNDAIDDAPGGGPLRRPCTIPYSPPWTVRPECNGYETCTYLGYGPCTISVGGQDYTLATLPDAEWLCDGLDDDCDGTADEDLLGTGAHCAYCGDGCPPQPLWEGQELHATPVCNPGSPPLCGAALCEFPWFDVDGDLDELYSTGCEVRDNTITIGGTEYLNNTLARAKQLAWTMGRTHFCEGYLPYDSPDNHLAAELDGPIGVDYYTVTFPAANPDDIDLYLWVDTQGEPFCESAVIYYCNSKSDGGGWQSCSHQFVFGSTQRRYVWHWFNPDGNETVTLQFRASPLFDGFACPYHFELIENSGAGNTTPNDYCH